MSTSTLLPAPCDVRDEPVSRTLADVLLDLGDIDAARVRWRPYPGTATVDDVIRIKDNERRLYELVDGVLVEKTMGFPESFLAAVLIRIIGTFVDTRDLGLVLGSDGMMQLFPDLLRMPDVSYLSWARVHGVVPKEAAPHVSPDLAIEVISPGNTKKEMKRKCGEYFQYGAKAVWLVDPATRTIAVHASPDNAVILTEADTLSGGDVLPGFSLDVAKLFGELDRKAGRMVPQKIS